MLEVCLDPQTSGGLLIAVGAQKAGELLERLREAGLSSAAVIGKVTDKGAGRIGLRSRGTRPIAAAQRGRTGTKVVMEGQERKAMEEEPCCADKGDCCSGEGKSGGQGQATSSGASEVETRFKEVMKAAGKPGALDAATKQAINIALAAVTRCGPCLRIHIQKARSMGFSEEEIDEAAGIAISFGGCPVMMFYNEVKQELSGRR
jgi:AhpD family alkylhydroperoxidase